MAESELRVVRLRDDFYQDGFYKIVAALLMIAAAILLLVGLCFYLISMRPAPVVFHTDNDWRAFPPVPIDQPYMQSTDLLQWVSNAVPAAFTVDFLHYKKQLASFAPHFTTNGLKKLIDLLNTYANEQIVENGRLYVQTSPSGAPIIRSAGLTEGKYGWWVELPIKIAYTGVGRNNAVSLVLQVLVIRVSTLNDLSGVAIDDILVQKNAGG